MCILVYWHEYFITYFLLGRATAVALVSFHIGFLILITHVRFRIYPPSVSFLHSLHSVNSKWEEKDGWKNYFWLSCLSAGTVLLSPFTQNVRCFSPFIVITVIGFSPQIGLAYTFIFSKLHTCISRNMSKQNLIFQLIICYLCSKLLKTN